MRISMAAFSYLPDLADEKIIAKTNYAPSSPRPRSVVNPNRPTTALSLLRSHPVNESGFLRDRTEKPNQTIGFGVHADAVDWLPRQDRGLP